MKKGQIEIIGLFVIIILLAIALLIALRFMLKEKTPILESQRDSLRITALMNALFSTHVDYATQNNQKIRDKIALCVTKNDCETTIQPNGMSVQQEIDDILKKIFNNENYYLIIEDKYRQTYIQVQSPPGPSGACSPDSISVLTTKGIVFNSPEINYRFYVCVK